MVSAGWYPDPNGTPCERYWDGNGWTLQTRPLLYGKPVQQSHTQSGELSTGWKIAIGISLAFGILILIVAASIPDFWAI
jgi:hypothetical protein